MLLFAVAAFPLRSVSAHSYHDDITLIDDTTDTEQCDVPDSGPWPDCAIGEVDDCIIPESGPWPPCATSEIDETQEDCVIPERGPWPPCATGLEEEASTNDCVIPDSGPWPPCATGVVAPPPHEECVIPESGVWPPCASEKPSTTDDYIAWRVNQAVEQLNGFWQPELGWRDAPETEPAHFEMYWGSPGDIPNAYYVPDLSAIFVDVRLLREVVDDFGEYAAVAVVAHEWGHFAQDALGILDLTRPRRKIELQADCFTGAFTRHLEIIGSLQAGEFESGSELFFASGDDQLSPDAPVPAPNQHGNGDERRAAYVLGWELGVQTCIDAY